MKTELQVCSLEQAKKLKELGVEQLVSLFEWTVYCPDPTGEKYYYIVMDNNHPDAGHAEIIASAFTVAELGIMLPLYCDSRKDGSWWVCDEGLTGNCVEFHADTEAEARAAMLIYILENSLTTSQDINNRIK